MKYLILLSLILFAFLFPTLAHVVVADGNTAVYNKAATNDQMNPQTSTDVGHTDVINDDTPTAIEELDNAPALIYLLSRDYGLSPHHKEHHLTAYSQCLPYPSDMMLRPELRIVYVKSWGFTPLLC